MRMTSVGKTCNAQKPDGRRCRAHALTSSEWCFFHDPRKVAERRAARRRGGIERTRKRVALPPGTANRSLKTAADACDLLGEMVNKVLQGELDPKVANSAAYICTILLKAQANSQVEQRLAELESIVRVQSLGPQPLQNPEPDLPFASSAENVEADTGEITDSAEQPQGGDDDK